MLSARRGFKALVFVSLTLSASGCGLQGCAQSFFNPTGRSTGAKLTAPKSARAGDTITLDAAGSEIQTGLGEPRCPQIVRFYLGPPGTFSNKKIDPKPIAVIKPTTKRVGEVPERHCPVVDGKVQVKVPSAPRAGVSDFEVAVVVHDLPERDEQGAVEPPFTAGASSTISVDTPAGQAEPGPGPANQAPVARFFALVEPAVQSLPIDLDARESFDPDGTIALYEWDFNGDGAYEVSTSTPFTRVADAGAPGTRRLLVRVTDDKGATAVSAPLDLTVVAPTAFTGGTFGFPAEVPVNTAFDVSVDNNVGGADVVALDTDNDGDFDDGLPNADANPAGPKPQFTGMRYGSGGLKRLRVLWVDNDPPNEFTVTTRLIKVNPAARIAKARASAARTRLSATLRPTAVRPVTVRRMSLVRAGVAVRGLILRGRLRGRVRAARRGQKVPPGARVLAKAAFAARLDGTAPVRPNGSYGTPTSRGLLLARAPSDRRTMVCLRVVQSSPTSTRFTVLGATGKARGLRASGAFPALRLDALGRRTRSARVAIRLKTGSPRGLSRGCRALTRHLPPR